MGNNLPHFNMNAISYIIIATDKDIQKILDCYCKLNLPVDDNLGVDEQQFNEVLNDALIHDSGSVYFDFFAVVEYYDR